MLVNLKFICVLSLIIALAPARMLAQQSDSGSSATVASGTLNIVLANKNGFVVATDSRMSSETPFPCNGRAQLYCDNSQKLFRTTAHSVMAIAGFAVGRANTPLDLTLASALRRMFPSNGLAMDERSDAIPGMVQVAIEDALLGVAAINDPSVPPENLSLTATFARLNQNHTPVLQQLTLRAAWTLKGPHQVAVPEYTSNLSPALPITRFSTVSVGIPFFANAILAGVYKSDEPSIQSYYGRRRSGQLDDMPLDQMAALARAILHETRKLTDLVGGNDEIAEFPSDGSPAFYLPNELSNTSQAIPRVMRWDSLVCSSTQNPPCGNVPFSFSVSHAQPMGEVHFMKLFLASEFKDVPVLLDGNLFIADNFEGATLKWRGQPFFSFRNSLRNCVLEVTEDARPDQHPELSACRILRLPTIGLSPNTVGLPLPVFNGEGGTFALPRVQP